MSGILDIGGFPLCVPAGYGQLHVDGQFRIRTIFVAVRFDWIITRISVPYADGSFRLPRNVFGKRFGNANCKSGKMFWQ